MPIHEKKQTRRLVLSRETIRSLTDVMGDAMTGRESSCGQQCTCPAEAVTI